MPYGVAINDAIKSGDRARMQQLLTEARQIHEQQGDLAKAIQELERAVASHKKS
jgi:uncharacterized protein YlxW (UPF0749 family)